MPSAFWSMAFACWLGTIFILYSKFFDLFLRGFYIPKAVIGLAGVFFLVSGKPLLFLRSTGGKIMVVLVFWVSVATALSIWRGGSYPYYTQLVQSLLFFGMAAGLPNVVSDSRKCIYTLAFSGLLAALLSLHWGSSVTGRLALIEGSYADPNYYAMALAAVIPFVWQMATTARSVVARVFAWLSMAPFFLALVKTGSRGAMAAFGVMLLLLLVISPLKTKIMLIIGLTLGLAVVAVSVPGYVRERYFTLFTIDPVVNQQAENGGNPDLGRLQGDVGSTEARRFLLQESINLTLEHPLTGVGPGCFQTAVFNEDRDKGIHHVGWMMTHNSYTQLSSETGLPGVILLLCLIAMSFKDLSVVLKGAKPEGANPDPAAYATAKSLLCSLVVVCVCVFFLAVVYDFPIFVWAGMTIGLRRTYEESNGRKGAVLAEPEEAPKATAAFAPSYARVQDRLPQRQSPTVSGKAVRFNRFR